MSESAVIRFLHQGLTSSGYVAAEPCEVQHLLSSPLAPKTYKKVAWAPGKKNGVSWIECAAPELPAPCYLTGPSSSTLDVARILGEQECLPEWASVLSLRQTAGRGQMRRNWVSPEGNLYAALRLPLEGPFRTFAAAPAIGALLACALNALGFPVALKWPNDLMLAPAAHGGTAKSSDFCKVGGILLEERGHMLLAGIGLNVKTCPAEAEMRDGFAFRAGILSRAEQRQEALIPCAPSPRPGNIFTLWFQLAAAIFSCYEKKTNPDTWWLPLAERYLAFRGRCVVLCDAIHENDTVFRSPCAGVVESVSPSGALLLKTEHGTESFLGGSLLLADRDFPFTRS